MKLHVTLYWAITVLNYNCIELLSIKLFLYEYNPDFSGTFDPSGFTFWRQPELEMLVRDGHNLVCLCRDSVNTLYQFIDNY